MRVWSKGLGTRELVIDFAKSSITREGDKVLVRGVIQEPIAWNFEITLSKEDVPGLFNVIVSTAVLSHFARNITGVFTFAYDKFIRRQRGRRPSESVGS